MMAKTNDKVFFKVTNKDIYDKLELIEKKLDTTNGKVRWVTKVAMGAMGLTIILLGFLRC